MYLSDFEFFFVIRFCQAEINKDCGPLKQTSCSENTIATHSFALLLNYSKRIETNEKLFSSLTALHVWEYQYIVFDFTNPQEIQVEYTSYEYMVIGSNHFIILLLYHLYDWKIKRNIWLLVIFLFFHIIQIYSSEKIPLILLFSRIYESYFYAFNNISRSSARIRYSISFKRFSFNL